MITRNQTKIKTVLTLAFVALATLAASASAELTESAGTLVASFDTGDRNSSSSGDYTVNSTAGPGVLHTDGLYMIGQSGTWTLITASNGSYGPVSGTDSQSGSPITFTYAAGGEQVQHNNQTTNTPPRASFWRYGPIWPTGDVISFTISGLDAGKTYDLIFYSGGELQGTTGRNCEVDIGGVLPMPDADGDCNFTGVAPSGGVISGNLMKGSYGDANIGRLAALQVAEAGSNDPNLPDVDAEVDMITLSGMDVVMAPTVFNNDTAVPQKSLSHTWTADPDTGVVITEDGINPDDPATKEATVTITKATANPSTVTLTLKVDLVGTSSTASDSMEIDVYNDACLAAKAVGPVELDPTDFDENCTTDLRDYAILAAKWLVDYALTAPVPKPL